MEQGPGHTLQGPHRRHRPQTPWMQSSVMVAVQAPSWAVTLVVVCVKTLKVFWTRCERSIPILASTVACSLGR